MKKNSTNKEAILVIIASLFFICYFAINYNKYFPNNDKKLNCNDYGNASLLEIYEAKNNNELAAKDKYLNKAFNFTGKVSSVNYNEFSKKSYLMIEDGYITVEVYIDKSQEDIAKKLNKDEYITFCATVEDLNPFIGAAISLKNAIIMSK